MEGKLCRWSVAIQEFDFTIKYKKGYENIHADTLSRQPQTCLQADSIAAPMMESEITCEQLKTLQKDDPVLHKVTQAVKHYKKPTDWKQFSLHRYAQLWPQLRIIDGIPHRYYCLHPGAPAGPAIVRPEPLQNKHRAYCIGMAKNVEQ